jgi:hypothetical protein
VKGDEIMPIKKFKLIIRPAILPSERHKIEDVLKTLNYTVWGGGTDTDMTQCDITFEKKEDDA